LLLNSGLDAPVIRPGMIVGVGGRGFDTTVGNAQRRVSIALGGDRPKMRTIALDDLIYYLVGVLDDPRAYRQTYDVGNDDVLSINQLIDTTVDILGRRHPIKTQIPLALLGALALLIERMARTGRPP
jgi:nucleoside-diphosphate-sugar epimerase